MSFPKSPCAVVTGAGSGLGRHLALDLAGRGASLVVSDIDLASAEETASLTRSRGARTEVIPCDVTDRAQVFSLIDAADQALGGLDVVWPFVRPATCSTAKRQE